MNAQNKNWKPLTLSFNQKLNDILQQQHHATQFIALTGRHLILQQADDSNTNMQYLPDQELLAGNELSNGLRVALQLTDLKLCLADQEGNCNNEISLNGKSKQMVLEELKKTLASVGIDVSKFKDELYYEIPTHKLNKGADFSVNDKKFFLESTFYRHNAEIVLNEIAHANDLAEPVRVWPHHFDTGTLILVAHNKKGELSKSIGLGWAIPDGMVDEPYYYLSFWSENPIEGLKKPEPLDTGEWMTPRWNGAILKHSDIYKEKSAEKQYKLVKSFFTSGINILKGTLVR